MSVQTFDLDLVIIRSKGSCVLVLDTLSMSGQPIHELREGLEIFAHELRQTMTPLKRFKY